MSGSRSWREYTSLAGTKYAINMDESNANATVGGAGGNVVLMAIPTQNNPAAPCGLKPSYINAYLLSNPRIRRQFKIGNNDARLALAQPGAQISAVVYANPADTAGTTELWGLGELIGEKSGRRPPAFNAADTGLTDGTTSQ
jgi:hypothetical protein